MWSDSGNFGADWNSVGSQRDGDFLKTALDDSVALVTFEVNETTPMRITASLCWNISFFAKSDDNGLRELLS